MREAIKTNKENLPILDKRTMTAVFDCVYGIDNELSHTTNILLKDEVFLCFVKMLNSIQEFNYRHRQENLTDLYPLFERTVGPMESNSEGTVLWLAMGLAIKETYQMRNKTLETLLTLIKTRK